ncbi:MAG TPA: hypothetical protein PK002_09080, partial [Cellvibrio sp.]|nr:hypothetical protein [Cellvibrio sp.]
LPEMAIWSLPALTLAGAVRLVTAVVDELELLTRLELLELTELELVELKTLELEELELITLAAELLVIVGGGLDLVPPLPPPQAVKVKPKRLAMKTGLINLIIVSGIQTAPLFIMLWGCAVIDCCKRLHWQYIDTFGAQLAGLRG